LRIVRGEDFKIEDFQVIINTRNVGQMYTTVATKIKTEPSTKNDELISINDNGNRAKVAALKHEGHGFWLVLWSLPWSLVTTWH